MELFVYISSSHLEFSVAVQIAQVNGYVQTLAQKWLAGYNSHDVHKMEFF